MLYISFQLKETTLRYTKSYFDFNYDDDWFRDETVKQMILDIDKSIVKSPSCIESPVLGLIPPTKISGGVKALILMIKEPKREIYATVCGDNCSEWILKIAEKQDVHIVLEHIMEFKHDFTAICSDTGQQINNLNDYRLCAIQGISS